MKKQTEIAPFAFELHVSQDSKERISLTDLWKEAGSTDTKRPNDWINRNSEFIDNVCTFLNATKNGIIVSKKGKGGGTFAHKQIALAYAKYLSPELHIAVNEIFFQRLEEEKNPQLTIDRGMETYRKMGKDEDWIKLRVVGTKPSRNQYVGTVTRHGARTPEDYSQLTNSIYEPLYGTNAKGIREKKGLPKGVNLRDNMTSIEHYGCNAGRTISL